LLKNASAPEEYVPATQLVQADCPVASEYLPTVQTVHKEAVPAEYEPAKQLMQKTDAEYLPASQSVH
jgi:hypothetical protein